MGYIDQSKLFDMAHQVQEWLRLACEYGREDRAEEVYAKVKEALLGAAAKIHEETDRPLIAISMGPLGAISRICGGYFGSAMTFAAAAQSSAPGQIPVQQLSTLLKLLESSTPQQSC